MARANMPKDWNLQEALSRKLTEDEREMLLGWNMQQAVADNDVAYGDAEAPDRFRKIDGGNTGDVDPFTRDTGFDATAAIINKGQSAVTPGQANRAEELANGKNDLDIDVEGQRDAEDALASSQAPDDEDGGDVDDTDEFGQMNNKQLREELKSRGLPTSGNRADLLGRVRTADAEG